MVYVIAMFSRSLFVGFMHIYTHTGCVGVVLVMMFVIATVVVIVCKWYVKKQTRQGICMNINDCDIFTLVSLFFVI